MHVSQNKAARAAALASEAWRGWFFDRFNADAQLVTAEAGETFIRQGDQATALFLLVFGRVSVHAVLSNGKRRILRVDRAPALLGEMELLELTPSAMSVQALEPCRLLRLPFSRCREALLLDPVFLRRLAILLGNKERSGIDRLFADLGYPLQNRLARFILETREEDKYLVRKVEAADSLGVSYRHLGQVLGAFVARGYLKKDRLAYTIVDEPALRALARQMEE